MAPPLCLVSYIALSLSNGRVASYCSQPTIFSLPHCYAYECKMQNGAISHRNDWRICALETDGHAFNTIIISYFSFFNLGRRTRAAASKEAVAAASAVPSAQSLDDSYCASPKRKDCKLDMGDDGSVKLEMKLTVSITAAPAKRSGGGTRASPTAKGKRQSPAITRFFSPQAKSPHQANCVHNDSNGDLNAIDGELYNGNCAAVSNGGSPRPDEPHQLKQQANADAATNDVTRTSNAICELVHPQKAHKSASEETAEDVSAGKYDGDMSICNGSASSIGDGLMFLSPVALNKAGNGKQSTPHRMVINASPVKPPLRYSKHTVSDFSQLKIGDASPTNKKSSNKRDKKTRRR